MSGGGQAGKGASQCPGCGAANRAEARFCDQCGGALQRPGTSYTPRHLVEKVLKHRDALIGERKRITVLFADIAGSTAIAEKAGAEGWHHILDGFFDLLTSAVHRYEGTVNQYTGDGIMALFGAPIAHEDHAPRACLAAVFMQREVARYAQEVRARHGIDLGLRIGLNSGEVVVGAIGDDLRMDYTAQGLTVNLAQRLESLCTPGRILLSRATGALVRDRFQLLDLGERAVEGSAHPIGVFELQGERDAAPTSWTQTLFVGRERELGALEAALGRMAHARQGEALTLVAGPGLGKTRLCWEFGRRCAAAGVAFHRSHCLPYTRALSLWPIRRLVRERLGIKEHAAAAEIRAIAEPIFQRRADLPPALLTRWLEFLGAGDETQPVTTQGLGLRKKLIDLVAEVLLAGDTPRVLVVEDLQWADTASEEFLQRLLEKIPDSRTVLLLTGRAGVTPAWVEAGRATHLGLGEFAGAELGRLATDWLGEDPSVRELLPKLQERTLGNPFFLEQAVRDLEQSGYLQGRRGDYRLVMPVKRWQIPDTVHGLLAARIDRLPPEQKPLLQAAAVIGARFTVDLLAEITGAPTYEVLGRLGALEAAGFVRRSVSGAAAGEFGFCHPLMQEVAYSAQLESRRKAIHLRLAESLELLHPENGRPCEEWVGTAHHFERAEEFARAGHWNLRAVGWASRWDAEVLLEQARAAVANLDRAGETQRTASGRIEARAALIRAGVHTAVPADEVEKAYREGQQLATRHPDAGSHAELVLCYGLNRLHRGDADAAAELTARAAQLRIAAGRRDWPGPFLDYVIYAHNTAGRLGEGMALARQLAGEDWTRAPVQARDYVARAEYAAALTYQGKLQAARSLLEEALVAAEGDDNTSAWINAFLVDWAVFSGTSDGVMQRARNALACADAFGSSQSRAYALCALGEAHCLMGAHPLAVAALEPGRPQFAAGAAGFLFQGLYFATLGEAYRGAGQANLAADTAEAGIAVAQRAKARVQELQCWSVLLSLPREGPWKDKAAAGLKRMEELIAFTGATVFVPWWCKWRARWAPTLQQRDQWRQQAVEEFRKIGAARHVQRLEAR